MGMDGDVEKLPSQISGGTKKRVGMARALALEPAILMFDEPTAGLDPISTAEIGELILRFKQDNIESIVVTHDIHGAKAISDRLVVLNEGTIAIDGTFDDLSKSDDPFVAQFLKDAS